MREATARIAHHGVEALSLRSLASASGVSTQVIYSMFGSRRGLIDAVVDQALQSLGDNQWAVGADQPALSRAFELAHSYRRWALANPGMLAILFSPHLLGFSEQQPDLADGTPQSEHAVRYTWDSEPAIRAQQPLLDTMEQLVAEGVFVDLEPRLLMRANWGFVHGLVTLQMAEQPTVGAVTDEEFDVLLLRSARAWTSPEFTRALLEEEEA